MSVAPAFDVVVPSTGRPSLGVLLDALAAGRGPGPGRVLVVDDRPGRAAGLLRGRVPAPLRGRLTVLAGAGAGPAAARNRGWRAARAPWVAFLDDDVVPDEDWRERLQEDLRGLPADVAGSQGRLRVPLPGGRRPTDWERNVAGLATARWATADLAYRRAALVSVGGFDERFRRAYREDADLGLRLVDRGWRIVRGRRTVTHPVGPADRWVSVRLQAGNADDALIRALHGRGWRTRAGAPPGRRPRHLAVTTAGTLALAAAVAGRRRLAAGAALGWLAGTAELAWARVGAGPRTLEETATMLATSVLLPPAASWHWCVGLLRAGRLAARPGPDRAPAVSTAVDDRERPQLVLLDRDGTLIEDRPYNGDPARVRPMPGARAALDRLRGAGVPTAVVSNQSGVARGLLTMGQVEAVNRRVEELLGPVGPWLICPHGPDDGCDCRKPAAGLLLRAARLFDVHPSRCAMIGDIGADVDAALAAGVRAVLVPTAVTRPVEVEAAPEVAPDLQSAVERLLRGPRARPGPPRRGREVPA